MNFKYTRVILRKLVVIVLRSKAQSEQNLFFSKAKKRTIKHKKMQKSLLTKSHRSPSEHQRTTLVRTRAHKNTRTHARTRERDLEESSLRKCGRVLLLSMMKPRRF